MDYFNGDRGTYVGAIKTVVNGWFNAFKVFAIIIMIIILVAIGIKSMIYAGTGNQKKISNMIVGWIIAIASLYFGPFMMKYAIELNDVFVKMIRAESKYSLYSIINYDFLEKYQVGEDSQTVTMEELLNEREEASGDMDKLLQELDAQKKALLLDIDTITSNTDITMIIWDGVLINGANSLIATIRNKTDMNKYFYNETGAFTNCKYVRTVYSAGVAMTVYYNIGADDRNLIIHYAQTYQAEKDIQAKIDALDKAIEFLGSERYDLMGEMRARAGNTWRLVYVLVWYVLIYQLVLLMILYYKRLLTVAVLITIFPLVVMMYAFEKFMGIEKPQSMKTWIIEYAVNIFIQSVHAILYVMLVETGVTVYEADHDNWLIFVFAVLALFPMESVIKGLLGMKASTVSNIKDSAKKGLVYGGAALAIAKAGGKLKDTDEKYEKKNKKEEQKNQREDDKRAYKRKKKDNKIIRNGRIAGNEEEARDIVRQRQEQYARKDKKRQLKRAKKASRRKVMKNLRKVGQVVRNVKAKVDAVAIGLAGGGDAEDFVAGAAIAGMVAGSTRPTAKVKTKKEDEKSGETQKSGDRYKGISIPASDKKQTEAEIGKSGYRSYGYSGGSNSSESNSSENNSSENTNTLNSEGKTPKVRTRVQDEIRRQLNNQRIDPEVRTNKHYGVIEKDE